MNSACARAHVAMSGGSGILRQLANTVIVSFAAGYAFESNRELFQSNSAALDSNGAEDAASNQRSRSHRSQRQAQVPAALQEGTSVVTISFRM